MSHPPSRTNHLILNVSEYVHPSCHETTARAARLERGFLVTLIRLASNVRVYRVFRLGTLEDFATLPQMKGRTGYALDEACWQVRED